MHTITTKALTITAEPVHKQQQPFLLHAMVYGIGLVLIQAAGTMLLPLYTHYLNPADFGTLEILSRTGQFIAMVLMVNGLGTATFTFYCQAKTAEERQEVTSTLFLFLSLVVLGGGILVVVCSQPLSFVLGIDSVSLTAIGVLVPFCDAATFFPLTLMQARTESFHYVCTTLAMLVCRVSAIIIAVVYFGMGLWGVIGASLLTALVFAFVLNILELAKGRHRPNLQILKKVARFSVPFVLSGLCFFVISSADRFLLLQVRGIGDVGIYSLGAKLGLVVGVFGFTPLFKVWSARMYDVFARKDAATIVGRAFTSLLTAYTIVGVAVCAMSENIVYLIAPPEYRQASAIVAPIVLAQFFNCAATLMDGVLYVHHTTRLKGWIALASALVACSLYALLIPRFGALGAAYASLGGFAFHAAATLRYTQKVFWVRYEYVRLPAMLGSAIVCATSVRWLGTDSWGVLFRISIVALWAVTIWIMGVVHSDDKRRIVGMFGAAIQAYQTRHVSATEV